MKNPLYWGWLTALISFCLWCGSANAEPAELVIQSGHTFYINGVCWRPNGKTLASIGLDRSMRIWDAASGQLLRVIDVGIGSTLAWDPNGQMIATGLNDGTIKLWDPFSGALLDTLKGHTSGVSSVEWNSDGTLLASASRDNTIRIWDLATKQTVKTLDSGFVLRVKWSPDGKVIASGGADGTVKTWNVASGQTLRTLLGGTKSIVGLSWNPNGQTLASGSIDGTIKLWDTASGELERSPQNNGEAVSALSWEPDGKVLAWGGEKGPVTIWDAESNRIVRTLKSHTATVSDLSWSPDGKSLASASFDDTLKIWDPDSGNVRQNLGGETNQVGVLTWSRDGKSLASGSHDRITRVWDIASGNLLHAFETRGIVGLSWSLDNKILSMGLATGTLSIDTWEVASETPKDSVRSDAIGFINSMAWSPDSKTVAFGSFTHTVDLMDPSSGRVVRSLGVHANTNPMDSIIGVAWSPDARRLVSSATDGTLKVWDVPTGHLLSTLEKRSASVPAWSPDGKFLACGDYDGVVTLWDTDSYKVLRTFSRSSSSVTSVAWSPDGKTIAVGDRDGSIAFWSSQPALLPKLMLYPCKGFDYVVLDPEGRFDGTPEGLKQLHYTARLEPIALDQLKHRFYTPGLWAKIMRGDLQALPVPPKSNEVNLYPEIEIAPLTPGDTKLHVTLTNQGGGIGRVEIKVNGKERTTDARGPGTDPNTATAKIEFNLSGIGVPGVEIPIEVIAWNAENDIRSRGAMRVFVIPGIKELSKPRFFAIVVGVSHFPADPNRDLQFSSKDADDVAKALELGSKTTDPAHPKLFSESHIYLLSSDASLAAYKPTKTNIERVFKDVRAQASPNDVLVMYFAGHGVSCRGAQGNFYCYPTQEAHDFSQAAFADPEERRITAVTSDDLVKWTNPQTGIKALKQVLILDTCAAGAVAGAVTQGRATDIDLEQTIDEMNESSGFYVLMGCAASDLSYESNVLRQGILTYSILQGMRGTALRGGRFVDVGLLFNTAMETARQLAKANGITQLPRIAGSVSTPFNIGDLDEEEKEQIPLAQVKPVLLRPTVIDSLSGVDDLGLFEPIAKLLRQSSLSPEQGDQTLTYLALEPSEFSLGIKPFITYCQSENGNMEALIKLMQKGKKTRELPPVTAPSNPTNTEEFVEKIVSALMKADLEK